MDYIIKLKNLIQQVVRERGSDLHLSSHRFPIMRINGSLVKVVSQGELLEEEIFGMLEEMTGKEGIAKFKEQEELDFAYEYEAGIRLRGNAFFAKGIPGIALRIIPKVRMLDELNLPKELENFSHLKQGFFLVVGPVGQGKSTTLAALIERINQERSEHIVTIEQPIEYVFESKKSIIDQREVGIDTKGFYTAMRSAFRQDANVIMIGEMRGPKTISAAVTAAETGHLVLSTLHTNTASQTIDRIIDSFPGAQQPQIRTQLANSLAGIFSQRLVPRENGSGLVPAYELLINNSAIANLIREGRTHEIDMVIETSREQGMIDMNHSLADLVRRGEISVETARFYSPNQKNFDRLIAGS